jgi:hypothetical protein
MRRIIISVVLALVMAAMMLAMMMPAFAGTPGPGECAPPGPFFSEVAKLPGSVPEFGDAPPGQLVKEFCTPGQQPDPF